MTDQELITLVMDTYATLRWAEDTDLADLDDLRLTELDELWSQLETLSAAVTKLRRGVEARMGEKIGDGRNYKSGPWVYRAGVKRTMKVAEPTALADWLGDDWRHVVPLTASTQVRKGGLEAVAKKRGIDDMDALYDTFFEWQEQGFGVRRVPADKAPKFLQHLEDGDVA